MSTFKRKWRTIIKKAIKILALLLLATLALTALVACFPSTNPEKTKKVLEEKGYTVTIETDQEKIAPPGYKAYWLKEGDIKATSYATNGKAEAEEVHVEIIYCKSASVAKNLWTNDDFKKALHGRRGRDGSPIWYGMSQVKDDSL